jgi:DNA-binding NtrC family response regulator
MPPSPAPKLAPGSSAPSRAGLPPLREVQTLHEIATPRAIEDLREATPEGYLYLVGESDAMRTVRAQLHRVAAHFRVVLITGEAGTGKELIARVMHRLGTQPPDAPFLSRSAASFLSLVPELLTRSAHERNIDRNTERNTDRNTRNHTAASTLHRVFPSGAGARATFFLGDVNVLTSSEQIYLLDALTRLEELRQGIERPRLIFATERDLRALTAAGQFDPKLFRRISAVEIALPPLRSRPEDIAGIAAELLASDLAPDLATDLPDTGLLANELLGTARWPLPPCPPQLEAQVLVRLQEYPWPSNVREFKRTLELAQRRAGTGAIELRHLPPLGAPAEPGQPSSPRALPERLDDVIRTHVLEILMRCSGNKVRAAERLGISRSTLYRTLEHNNEHNNEHIAGHSTPALLERAE